jgi:hypothetical protein
MSVLPKDSWVEGLASSVMPTGGTFGKRLDREGADPINELIQGWIHNGMCYWEVVEII